MNKESRLRQSELFLIAEDRASEYCKKMQKEFGYDDAFTSYCFLKANLTEYCSKDNCTESGLDIVHMHLLQDINLSLYKVNPTGRKVASLHQLRLSEPDFAKRLGFKPISYYHSIKQETMMDPVEWKNKAKADFERLCNAQNSFEKILNAVNGHKHNAQILNAIFFRAMSSFVADRLYITHEDMKGLLDSFVEWVSIHQERDVTLANAVQYSNGKTAFSLCFPLSFRIRKILD